MLIRVKLCTNVDKKITVVAEVDEVGFGQTVERQLLELHLTNGETRQLVIEGCDTIELLTDDGVLIEKLV